jgi:hypothetical protein
MLEDYGQTNTPHPCIQRNANEKSHTWWIPELKKLGKVRSKVMKEPKNCNQNACITRDQMALHQRYDEECGGWHWKDER